ncbi:MAG: BamA/TamA family outer membrane protein [Chitinophagales bacterium]|nr:BamA/TamA family outer membrane protein [Chitinophagales bacterium]
MLRQRFFPACLLSVFYNQFLICVLFVFNIAVAAAQISPGNTTDSIAGNYLIINQILIEGNHRTKPQVIERQLTFRQGDTIQFDGLMKEMEISKNHLLNIGLFNTVVLNIKNWKDQTADIVVIVTERWYIFPVPVIHLYDRNFNVWWVDHDHQLKWLQLGVKFLQQNFRGRDEDLSLTALFGFARTFDLQYNVPYFDQKQKNGFRFVGAFNQTRNITYQDSANRELIYENIDLFQRRSLKLQVDLFHNPRFNYKSIFSLGYFNNSINDTITHLNPDYFLGARSGQQYLYARATFIRDFRDIVAYPLSGSYSEVSLEKFGLGLLDDVNIFSVTGIYNKYFPLGKKWYMSSHNKLKISFPGLQPLNLERGIGYKSEYLPGYEYYVIDGPQYGYTKLDLKNQLFKINLPVPGKSIFYNNSEIPLTIYTRAFLNAGYVRNKFLNGENKLNNTLLFSGGIGLDFHFIYDTTLRVEYSVNGLGEKGLFLHAYSFF